MAFDVLSFVMGQKAAGGSGGAEAVEASVDLDFTNGDMEVAPEEGKSFSKVSIPKPETLLPENIAEGIEIAGIIGTLAGGGGNIKATWGTFTGTRGTSEVVTHGLGVIPDFVIVCAINYVAPSTNDLCMMVGYSTAFKAKIGGIYPGSCVSKTSSSFSFGQFQKCIDLDAGGYFIGGATTETVTLDSRLTTGRNHVWIAVGGLT